MDQPQETLVQLRRILGPHIGNVAVKEVPVFDHAGGLGAICGDDLGQGGSEHRRAQNHVKATSPRYLLDETPAVVDVSNNRRHIHTLERPVFKLCILLRAFLLLGAVWPFRLRRQGGGGGGGGGDVALWMRFCSMQIELSTDGSESLLREPPGHFSARVLGDAPKYGLLKPLEVLRKDGEELTRCRRPAKDLDPNGRELPTWQRDHREAQRAPRAKVLLDDLGAHAFQASPQGSKRLWECEADVR
mmetsp:Transcript_8989/g.33910  ORF Transcript_8989/g.33910 Transcript_8989/m.33910 type:complete len:245 (+) Transcript_8989:4382-5116(+)